MKKFNVLLACLCFFVGGMVFGQAQIKEDGRLADLMQTNANLIKNNKLGGRYKIQLGSFNSIKDAEKIKNKFEASYPGVPVQLQYESPNYKVWAGDFTSRLAADRLFLSVKKSYKSSFVFKPKG